MPKVLVRGSRPPAAILKQAEAARRTEILSGVNKLFREFPGDPRARAKCERRGREGKPGCVVDVEGGLPLETPSEARAVLLASWRLTHHHHFAASE